MEMRLIAIPLLCSALFLPGTATANRTAHPDGARTADPFGTDLEDVPVDLRRHADPLEEEEPEEDEDPSLPDPDEPTEDEIASPVTGLPTFSASTLEDDEPFEFEGPTTLVEEKAKDAPTADIGKPGPVPLEVIGKEPLKDNYPLSIVAVDRDSVVVELPVMIARSRAELKKDFSIVGEVWVGEVRVSEVRQIVQASSLAEFGPSFAFLKVLVPVTDPAGEIRVVVKSAPVSGGTATELFSTKTAYALK